MFHYFVRCGDAMEWSNDVDDDDVGEAPSRDWFHTIIACNWDIKLRFYGEKYSFNWTINHYHPFGLRMNQKHTSHSQWYARRKNAITNKGTPNRKADVNAKNRSWKGRVRCIVFAVAFCVLNFAVVFFSRVACSIQSVKLPSDHMGEIAILFAILRFVYIATVWFIIISKSPK